MSEGFRYGIDSTNAQGSLLINRLIRPEGKGRGRDLAYASVPRAAI
jgi:hypothetical protein